jgi:hypothetical protein
MRSRKRRREMGTNDIDAALRAIDAAERGNATWTEAFREAFRAYHGEQSEKSTSPRIVGDTCPRCNCAVVEIKSRSFGIIKRCCRCLREWGPDNSESPPPTRVEAGMTFDYPALGQRRTVVARSLVLPDYWITETAETGTWRLKSECILSGNPTIPTPRVGDVVETKYGRGTINDVSDSGYGVALGASWGRWFERDEITIIYRLEGQK